MFRNAAYQLFFIGFLLFAIIVGSFCFSGGTQINTCHWRVLNASCDAPVRDSFAMLLVVASLFAVFFSSKTTQEDEYRELGLPLEGRTYISLEDFLRISFSRGILHPKLGDDAS